LTNLMEILIIFFSFGTMKYLLKLKLNLNNLAEM
jgi:hypothetical protein